MLCVCRKTIGGFLVGLAIVAAGQEFSFLPVNAQMFRFRRSGGTGQFFVRDRDEPNLLHGERPWTTELDGRHALVMANADDEKAVAKIKMAIVEYAVRRAMGGENLPRGSRL